MIHEVPLIAILAIGLALAFFLGFLASGLARCTLQVYEREAARA